MTDALVKESGGKLAAIPVSQGVGAQIQNMADSWTLAQIVVRAGMAPRGLDKPEKLMLALAAGAEAGLGFTATLKHVMVVNNVPSLYGDGPMALCYKSGLVENFDSGFSGTPFDDDYTAWIEVKRREARSAVRREFSVADAKAAGLWGKAGPWKQHPGRMLFVRARAFALRDAFPDVLAGIAIAEEQEDIAKAEASKHESRSEEFEEALRAVESDKGPDIADVEWSRSDPGEPQEAAEQPTPEPEPDSRKNSKRKPTEAPEAPDGIDPEEVTRPEMAEAGLEFEDGE